MFTVLGNFSLSWHFKINFVGKLKIIKVDLEEKKKTHLNNIWWQKGNIPAWLWKNVQETYNVHEMFVCVSVVPLLKTRLLASNIGIPLDFCFVLMFQCFFLYFNLKLVWILGSMQTILLFIPAEYAGGGSVAVAVGISGR